jgi:signal peptidase I
MLSPKLTSSAFMRRTLVLAWGGALVFLVWAYFSSGQRGGWAGSFTIASRGMAPTLVEGDIIRVRSIQWDKESPRRYDLVVVRPPAYGGLIFPRRVLGLPGDDVTMTAGSLVINGSEIRQEALPVVLCGKCWTRGPTSLDQPLHWKLGARQVLVIGDNVTNTCDSRDWGPLDLDAVVGVVVRQHQSRLWRLLKSVGVDPRGLLREAKVNPSQHLGQRGQP